MIEKTKDIVAQRKGYPSWMEMENFIIDHNKPVVVAQLLVSAMEDVYKVIKESAIESLRKRAKISSDKKYAMGLNQAALIIETEF